jgi:hypothetical protein
MCDAELTDMVGDDAPPPAQSVAVAPAAAAAATAAAVEEVVVVPPSSGAMQAATDAEIDALDAAPVAPAAHDLPQAPSVSGACTADTLQMIVLEAFLRRMSRSAAGKMLVLKGSFLTRYWSRPQAAGSAPRSVADLDFEAIFPCSRDVTEELLLECCSADVNDGCSFFLLSCAVSRKDFPCPLSDGCEAKFNVAMVLSDGTTVALKLSLDVGWGDPMWSVISLLFEAGSFFCSV